MLSMNNLKTGTYFVLDGQPHEVLEARHLKMQQRRPVLQTKIKNLISGKTFERNFQQSDAFEEAEVSKKNVKYLYGHRGEYWFSEENDPSKRFKLEEEKLGEAVDLLKPNTILEALLFDGEIINVNLPIKMDFKVIEAPPSMKGGTAQAANKQVTIETGAKINVPEFINEGDTIRVNTRTGEYVERVEKK